MELKIKDIHWDGKDVDASLNKDLLFNISKKLKDEYKVTSNHRINNGEVSFLPTEEKGLKKYLFTSAVENKIPLDPKGAMAKKLGRDYMVSHRLTKKQWDAVNDCIIKSFDNLKLNCTIEFNDGASTVVLRSGKVNNHWPSPNKFTEEK
jgi:hypothetical protein